MPSKKVSIPKKSSSKIIFNLKDVNKAPEFNDGIPFSESAYQFYNKRISMFFVEHAQKIVERHNFLLDEYPKLTFKTIY